MREVFIFKIRFIDASLEEITEKIKAGGLMVVPSAPGLVTIFKDKSYYKSLKESNFAIFDSGFLCLCLLFLKGVIVQKVSGLAFISAFISNASKLESGSIFLIDPTAIESDANRDLFLRSKYTLKKTNQYIAPIYKKKVIEDSVLLSKIKKIKPKYIIINIAGGVQEKLGLYLYQNIKSYKPSIICTGAAIAFLTKKQAPITPLLDKVYLGWLVRCVYDYKQFIPRYLKGFKLIPMIINEKINLN
jgi:N-acetylglucosaminyldiphosphoundecaprenol N-acetyl-beta-D-mannosaminyltransferase